MKIPVGYCGLYCAECAIYLTCHSKEPKPQASDERSSRNDSSTAELPKNVSCEGCHSDDASCYGKDCEIRRCARAKRITFCYECPEYLCEKLTVFYSDHLVSHNQTQANLEEIRDMGLAAWLEKKQRKA